jgi:hypothetical protein
MDRSATETPAGEAAPGTVPAAALDALLAVLRPLASLAVDHGVQFGQLEELLKRAMVEAALHATAGEGRRAAPPVSRLSVITGIHRKEVKRLAEGPGLDAVRAESTPAAQLFTRWLTDPAWQGADGRPRPLSRRTGAEPTPGFEELARSVTTDVHPRTLLDELLRLELASVDDRADTVRLRSDAFVPAGRMEALLAFLGANVGDHLAAARANVAARLRAGASGTPPAPFVEQALFADELSADSAALAGDSARAFWSTLLSALAPELQRLEQADRSAGRPADHRVRIGLYCYSEPMAAPPPSDEPR